MTLSTMLFFTELMKIKLALTITNLLLGIFMYLPLWLRIARRKTTGDFSKVAYAMVLAIQFVNLALAWLEQAPFLLSIYIVHSLFVAATMWLIWRYYD